MTLLLLLIPLHFRLAGFYTSRGSFSASRITAHVLQQTLLVPLAGLVHAHWYPCNTLRHHRLLSFNSNKVKSILLFCKKDNTKGSLSVKDSHTNTTEHQANQHYYVLY